jgi:dTDP-4-dehydrorhamnose reductase
MKILVTGANGFVGYYTIKELLANNYSVIATGKGESRLPFAASKNFMYVPMDFTNPVDVYDVLTNIQPDVVIHAGAMGKPDECELNQMQAYITNTEGTMNLLHNADNCHFIFVSTDFVFDGAAGPYKEEDAPNPINYYGVTKQHAEDAVKEFSTNWCIVRTVLVYGKPLTGRNNLLTIVKNKLQKGEEYNVVTDQERTPTYVEDLAKGIVSIIKKKATGIYHISGDETFTPYDMAVKTAEYLGLNKNLLNKVTAASFKEPAKRPPLAGFIIDKAKNELGYSPISFEKGLKKTFEE